MILAGGEASRFDGRAKGLERVGDRRILDIVADALRPVTDELWLVANAPEAAHWLAGVRVVRDVLPERGSLAGLYSAFVSVADPILVVAWDMPFVTSPLLAALRSEGERGEGAVVPETDGRLQPFCAYYPHAAIETAKRLLDRGERRMTAFLDGLPHVARFDETRLRPLGDSETMFFNVNTNEDLEHARVVANTRPRA